MKRGSIYDKFNNKDIGVGSPDITEGKIVYKGRIDEDSIDQICEASERMISEDGGKKRSRKLFSILIEALQNIFHHSDDRTEDRTGAVAYVEVVKESPDSFEILIGHLLLKELVDDFRQKIDWVNSLSADELKENYIRELDEGRLSEKGGAGLGLIEIARRSGNRLEYNFLDANADEAFFEFRIKI